jgi:hypothetical protein
VVSEVTRTGVPGVGTAIFPSDRGWSEGESAMMNLSDQSVVATGNRQPAT